MAPASSSANLSTPGAPPRLGRYEILGRLAAGGMAEILLGRVTGPHAFERLVAMKRILPHLAENREFLDMFVNEARIAASIRHARVVQVHELAECDDEYVLVMEYVAGENLGGLMRRLRLRGESLDRVLAAHIIAEACAGLHAAHEISDGQGARLDVVHRDVSPQNVMITYAGEVKILDFGIAKASHSGRTQSGHVRGKCEYMSPEQCRGEPLDRRSDVFSLGILLYELTVGRRLFKRDNMLLAFHAVCYAPIPRPTEVDPSYPHVLEPICARALARDRRDRYATMLDMRRDLVAAARAMVGAEWRAGEDELLAGLMSRLFADRIEEKREMLHRARIQAPIASIPSAEVDADVELPEVPRESRVQLAVEPMQPPPARAPTRRRRGLVIAATTMAAMALGGVVLWPADSGNTPSATADTGPAPLQPRVDEHLTSVPAAVPVTVPAPLPDPQVVPQKPAMVSLTVESIPPGAAVLVAGTRRGSTPCSIELARASDALTVVVSRSGFKRVAERVVPDADQKLVVHLQPVRATARPTKSSRSPSTPPKEKQPVFDRFD